MKNSNPAAELAKEQIELLINNNQFDAANLLIAEFEADFTNDVDVMSMRAVMLIVAKRWDEAEMLLLEGLILQADSFDLLYNLAYLHQAKGDYRAAWETYQLALAKAPQENIAAVENAMALIAARYPAVLIPKRKLAFFVRQGMDSFLGDIIAGLSDAYETKKIIVTQLSQINVGMEWADICWFEWCDELIIYGSKLPLAATKKLICRCHSFEAFTPAPTQVNWQAVDALIFVAESIKNVVLNKVSIDPARISIIPSGIPSDMYTYRPRQAGYNLAYVGYINYKKGPMLLLHTFKAIVDRDNRYKLYIAGTFQDERDVLYFNQMTQELKLENNLIFQGWQNNLDEWLEDKNYILCTSILESQNLSVMQAMSKGIKPIIHNFVGAKAIYPTQLIWNTIEEAVAMVTSADYHTQAYRDFIVNNYELSRQLLKLEALVDQLAAQS
ncbi:MAG: glycosyltransferase [Peptococcaceae bacterium]|nr:glycosyltransferase [Peptococcaceae bacterium]